MSTTNSRPPRLALALLRRHVDDEALVGDLVEEFETRRSSLWLWRQALLAALMTASRDTGAIRPLRLVEGDSTLGSIRPPNTRDSHAKTVNLAASPRGAAVGGLGLVAPAVLVTIVVPQAWWLVVFSALGGVLLGVVLVVFSRRRVLSGRGNGDPNVLLGRHEPERSRPDARPGRH